MAHNMLGLIIQRPQYVHILRGWPIDRQVRGSRLTDFKTMADTDLSTVVYNFSVFIIGILALGSEF
jgi:hypothetical protein